MGFRILDSRFPIANRQLALSPTAIANRQLTIGNRETHLLPRGGTDFMGPRQSGRKWIIACNTNDKFVVAIRNTDENVSEDCNAGSTQGSLKLADSSTTSLLP